MNAIVEKMVELALRKYKEPSTWIPIVTAIGVALHQSFPPDMQDAIAGVFAAIVGLLFVAINEHKAAAAPAGNAPPAGVRGTDATAGISPAAGGARRDVQAGSQPAARRASTELDPPGFNDNGPN